MNSSKYIKNLVGSVAVSALLFTALSAQADQLTVTYVDGDSNAQTLNIDCNSSQADLQAAAGVFGEYGVAVSNDSGAGCSTLAELAAAMAAASPMDAAEIAMVLSLLDPSQTDAIVAAVSAVAGVNTGAVLAAVTHGPVNGRTGSQMGNNNSNVELPVIEQVPSRN